MSKSVRICASCKKQIDKSKEDFFKQYNFITGRALNYHYCFECGKRLIISARAKGDTELIKKSIAGFVDFGGTNIFAAEFHGIRLYNKYYEKRPVPDNIQVVSLDSACAVLLNSVPAK